MAVGSLQWAVGSLQLAVGSLGFRVQGSKFKFRVMSLNSLDFSHAFEMTWVLRNDGFVAFVIPTERSDLPCFAAGRRGI